MNIFDRDTLQAFCRHTHVALDPIGHGALDGLTFGLKDNFDVAGHRTGFGSPDWLRTHEPAARHAPVLTRLLAAGAEMVGKTHTEEMTFSLTGENAHYGTPINPAAPDLVPGGSSSGSASAVAGGLVDFDRQRHRWIGARTGQFLRDLRHPSDTRAHHTRWRLSPGADVRYLWLVCAGRGFAGARGARVV